jgi:SAM-dependent methyltransferase
MESIDERGKREILHGAKLVQSNPDLIWGWGTKAGKIRAKRRANYISRLAQLSPRKIVLEIGCGTGLFTEMFAFSGAEIVAVDISHDLLEIARSRDINPEQVQFLENQFENVDFNGGFDAVIGSSILHHLDLDVALKKIFDLLRPGGLMSFAEPNMLNPQVFLQKNVSWIKEWTGDSPDETAFVSWRLKKQLETAGFTEIKIMPRDWLHPAVPETMIPAVTWMESRLEKIPLIREFAGSLYISCKRPD